MNKKKIIFMGTPDFAIPTLEMLIKNYDVKLVITQPDKFVGRKKVLVASPVKQLAEKNNIEIMQPIKISNDNNVIEKIKNINPDLIVTAAYGQLVPDEILNIPKYKSINVHGSLLPKLRGGAPVEYALLEGHKKTGVTIMYMVKKLDAGDMISKQEIDILDTDNYDSLYKKLSIIGRDLLEKTLPDIFTNNIYPKKQDDSEATFAKNITRDDEKIDWNNTARDIFNKVRAFDSKPGAFTYLNNNVFKIWKTSVENNDDYKGVVGEIVAQDKKYLYVLCKNDTLLKLEEVQLSGKKRVKTQDFLSNNKNYIGLVLGELNEK